MQQVKTAQIGGRRQASCQGHETPPSRGCPYHMAGIETAEQVTWVSPCGGHERKSLFNRGSCACLASSILLRSSISALSLAASCSASALSLAFAFFCRAHCLRFFSNAFAYLDFTASIVRGDRPLRHRPTTMPPPPASPVPSERPDDVLAKRKIK